MSERESGFGAFLLGIAVGAVLGFLFAPEPGEATRGRLSRRLRGLRELAAEKAGQLGALVPGEQDAGAPSAREELRRRLEEARRRRRAGGAGAGRHPGDVAAEEDEPVA